MAWLIQNSYVEHRCLSHLSWPKIIEPIYQVLHLTQVILSAVIIDVDFDAKYPVVVNSAGGSFLWKNL